MRNLHSISTNLGINSALLLAAMRDRASVNDVAIRTLKILYPNLELLVFGSEKNRLCLVLKGTLVTNLSTIENKTCGRVSYHCWPGNNILITEIHVVVYWNGILTTKKCKYLYHIIFKHSFFSYV